MLKKRLVGMVTVRKGLAVQSFGFNRYLPVGRPECVVENLDRWGADEICVLAIDRAGIGPNFDLLRSLAALGLSTPLIYGGGIGSPDDGVKAIQCGADRLCIDAMFRDDPDAVTGLSERLGAQALIASLPLSRGEAGLQWLNYRHRVSAPLSVRAMDMLAGGVVSEALIIDWQNEGIERGFDGGLVDVFPVDAVPLIAFGGLSEGEQLLEVLAHPRVAAVAIGNFLNYRENAVQTLKEQVIGMPVRPAVYEAGHSILPRR